MRPRSRATSARLTIAALTALAACGEGSPSVSPVVPTAGSMSSTTRLPTNPPGSGCVSPRIELLDIERPSPTDDLVVTARIAEMTGEPIPGAMLRIYMAGAAGFEADAAARDDGTVALRVSNDAIAFAKSAIPNFSNRFIVSFEGSYDAKDVDENRPVGTVFCDAETTSAIPHAS